MNLLTQALHLLGSGATAYITARNLRDPQTRPDLLAGFQLAEAGAVPFLEALAQRARREGDDWLAEQLLHHAQDERRHSQIFAHALKQLNKQVIDFRSASESTAADAARPQDQSQDQTSSSKQPERRSPFFDAYYAGYTRADLLPEAIDWTVFFFSTHILELDASKDFLRMAEVLPDDAASLNLQKGLVSIANDEKRHAAYLLEAAGRRMPQAQVAMLVDEWRERKVNALLAMVSNLLGKGGAMPSLARDGVPVELNAEVQPSPASAPASSLAA